MFKMYVSFPIAMVAVLLAALPVLADEFVISGGVDGIVRDYSNDGVFTSLSPSPSSTLSIRKFNSTSSGSIPYDERSILEFNVGSLNGLNLQAAQFEFDLNGFTSSSPPVNIFGYLGDGSVSLGDATTSGVLLGSYTPSAIGQTSVSLNTTLLSTITQTSDYLGLRLQGSSSPVNTQLHSVNSSFGLNPQLRITAATALPEYHVLHTAVNSANGHTYHLLAATSNGTDRFSGLNWSQGEQIAQEVYSSHLVTINDAAENEWVLQTFKDHTDRGFTDGRIGIYLGYSDADTEGAWVWSSDQSPGYENWAANEPNGAFPFDGTADYALMLPWGLGSNPSSYGQWFDEHDVGGPQTTGGYIPNYVLVEVVPEPASAVTILLSIAAIFCSRRAL